MVIIISIGHGELMHIGMQSSNNLKVIACMHSKKFIEFISIILNFLFPVIELLQGLCCSL